MRSSPFAAGVRLAALAGLPIAALLAAPAPAGAAPASEALIAWRAAVTRTPPPQEGCFHAAFPSVQWQKVACVAAPLRPYLPRSGHGAETVGNGHDYAAVTASLTSSAVGSFPAVSGVKSERDFGTANTYSLQLNSGFMNTAGCNGGAAGCQTWLQYVYSSSSQAAFMQYWLIGYGSPCPAGGGWNSYSGSCYKNSAAVAAPKVAITQLGSLSISGSAVKSGLDTLVFTTATNAYTTTGPDSVVDLATAWTQSEFNVIGDGGGSQAKFNRGSHVTVGIAVSDGGTAAPICAGNAGTTGETNNLSLHACSSTGGAAPAISFTESN